MNTKNRKSLFGIGRRVVVIFVVDRFIKKVISYKILYY